MTGRARRHRSESYLCQLGTVLGHPTSPAAQTLYFLVCKLQTSSCKVPRMEFRGSEEESCSLEGNRAAKAEVASESITNKEQTSKHHFSRTSALAPYTRFLTWFPLMIDGF